MTDVQLWARRQRMKYLIPNPKNRIPKMSPRIWTLPSEIKMKTTRTKKTVARVAEPNPRKAKKCGSLLPYCGSVRPRKSVNRRPRPTGFSSDIRRTLRNVHGPVYALLMLSGPHKVTRARFDPIAGVRTDHGGHGVGKVAKRLILSWGSPAKACPACRWCVDRTAPQAGTSAGCCGALVAGPGFQGAVVAGTEASFAVMAWASFWIVAP